MGGVVPSLPITMLIDGQDAFGGRGSQRIRQQELKTPGLEGSFRPGRLGEKPLQGLGPPVLGADDGLGIG